VLNDPGGRDRLTALGIRKIPAIARGREYVFGQNLEDVARFVGLSGTGHQPLPPAELMNRWLAVLRAAQRYVKQIPDERLGERVIPNRDRPIRLLAHHVFRIGEAFVETMPEGKEYAEYHAQQPPAEGTMLSTAEIARYGDGVIARLEQWWHGVKDPSAPQSVKTYYGDQPLHELLERSTWHSAQHGRQLIAVLERYGIAPDRPLTQAELGGLPLPERLWE
jgi:hypothetical protein